MRVDRATPTAVALDDATVAFRLADNRVYTAVEQARLAGRAGRIRRHCRADRMREIDAAQCGGRPAQAGIGKRADFRCPARRAEPGRRLSVPGRCAVSLEDRDRQRRHRARDRGHAARARRWNARKAGSPRSGFRRFRQPLSAHALRRPAQARGPCAGPDPRSQRSS